MDSACVRSVPTLPDEEYHSVCQEGVPPVYSSTVVAVSSNASILPVSILNSASVRSDVQHNADAGKPFVAGVKGSEHLEVRLVRRMFVVVCRSHCECRHTSPRSLAKVTSPSSQSAIQEQNSKVHRLVSEKHIAQC